MIKQLLEAIANKYNVTLSYQESHAEFTGFPDTFAGRFDKGNLRADIEELLIAQGCLLFKTYSSVNPSKITVEWEN